MIVPVRQVFTRFAGEAHAWLGELPEWAAVDPVGVVDSYWRWWDNVPPTAVQRHAAWGYRVGLGGGGEYGLLGASFEPHDYPYLRVAVAATQRAEHRAQQPFDAARIGLLHEYAGGVLAGALQEPHRLGPGTLSFKWAAVHEVDSSWEVFRVLAIGVVRLLSLPLDSSIPDDLLPYFGGEKPPAPGT